MKWPGQKREDRFSRRLKWHRWFAWFPIQTEDYDWYWLEFVERKYKNRGAAFFIYRRREV